MSAELLSIISTIVNLLLTAAKLFAGIFTGSASLIAEAIHSGLDVVSSFVTFFGIKTAKKPKDKKHPYGHYRAEVIAGAAVTVLLAASAVWIIYEGVSGLLHEHHVSFSIWGVILMIVSVILNEIAARMKFKIGNVTQSISLIADGEHSRADVISSAGVLIALILVRYISWIDAAVAVLVGAYILYESFELAKEALDSLLDSANPPVEKEIVKILENEKVKARNLTTRRLGAVTVAQITILLSHELKLEEATQIAKKLEKRLIKEVEELHQIAVLIESHDLKATLTPEYKDEVSVN